MCGRFTQNFTWEQLHALYALSNATRSNLEPSWNLAPTQLAGVVIADAEEGRRFQLMRWGLIPFWAKDDKIGASLINARIETAAEKPAFRAAWKARRCIVPASGFYEWRAVPGLTSRKPVKQPYYIYRKDKSLLSFAGLWEKGREGLLTFTIVTTGARSPVNDLHDRMPVMLDQPGIHNWLHGGLPPEIDAGIEAALTMHPVSRQMNAPQYNAPDCVTPLGIEA